jgi:hypothetical protein
MSMATIHISEADAVRDLAGLLAHVRLGAEIVIESGTHPPAVLAHGGSAAPLHRGVHRPVARRLPGNHRRGLRQRCCGGIAAHREPLNPPAWD